MSLMFLAALAATTASVGSDTAIGPKDWSAVVHTARQTGIPAEALYHAMTDIQVHRPSSRQTRLCLRRDEIVPGKSGMVCRTHSQWAAYGMEMPDPRS